MNKEIFLIKGFSYHIIEERAFQEKALGGSHIC